jgi:hypothetical protein
MANAKQSYTYMLQKAINDDCDAQMSEGEAVTEPPSACEVQTLLKNLANHATCCQVYRASTNQVSWTCDR